MSQPVVIANAATVELSPSPVPESWVMEGRPQAKATAIARSQDRGMMVIAWLCTRGRFRWHYQFDQMCHILAGEAFITEESGGTRRLGPGNTVFFPSGSTADWRVTADIRKIAVCRMPVPRLVGLALRAWNKLRRTAARALLPDAEPAATQGRLSSAREAAQAHSIPASPPG
jgi:uncharacterized cupin superfamily protein